MAAVGGHDTCSALQCPLRSTPLAVAALMTIGTISFSSAHSSRSSLCMLGRHPLSGSPEGFRSVLLPSPGLVRQPRGFTRVVVAVACYSFLEPQVGVGCKVDSNVGRAALKRTWLAPLQRCSPHSSPHNSTPQHPGTRYAAREKRPTCCT